MLTWMLICYVNGVGHFAQEEYQIVRQEIESSSVDSFVDCIRTLMENAASRKTMGEAVFGKCPDTGKIFGALVKGIKDAGFVRDWSLSKEDESVSLEVLLNQEGSIYGELASASKVPLAFKVDQKLVFTVTQVNEWKTIAAVEGLGVVTPAEGLEAYIAATNDARCTDAELTDLKTTVASWDSKDTSAIINEFKKTCVYREQQAAGAYLPTWYKKVKSNKADEDRKVSRLFRKIYGSSKFYLPIKAAGEWPKIFYSVITSGPSTFTSFTFHDEKYMSSDQKKKEKVGVMAVTEKTGFWEGNSYSLNEKSPAIGTVGLVLAKGQLSMAEGMAKSGMAFAEMVSWGAGFEALLKRIDFPHMANVGALMNMFSFCDEGQRAAPSTFDPSCSGDTIGRVSWGATLSNRFL